jgi:hypothetical protein
MNLRVLFIPELYSSNRLDGISMVNNTLDLARATIGQVFWYFVVPPEKDSDFEPMTTALPSNVSLVTVGPRRFEPSLPMNLPPNEELVRWLVENAKDHLFDLVLNQKYNYSSDIKMLLYQRDMMWRCASDVPVVTYYTEAGDDKDNPFLFEEFSIMSVVAGLVSGSVVVLNDCDKKSFLNLANKYLSSSTIRQKWDRLRVVRPILDWSQVDRRASDYVCQRDARRKTGVIHLFHGGTFEGKRHIPEMVDLIEKLFSSGLDARLVLKTQWTEERASGKNFPARVLAEYGVMRERYLETLGDGDILLCTPNYEGTGLAYMEAVRSGQIPVFLNRPWIRERVPEWYPYFAGSVDSMGKVIHHIIGNLDEARVHAKRLVLHWEPMFKASFVAKDLLRLFETLVSEVRTNEEAKVRKFFYFDAIRKFCESNDDFTLSEYMKKVRDYAESRRINPNSFGKSYMRRAALVCGFEEDCSCTEPRFRRV